MSLYCCYRSIEWCSNGCKLCNTVLQALISKGLKISKSEWKEQDWMNRAESLQKLLSKRIFRVSYYSISQNLFGYTTRQALFTFFDALTTTSGLATKQCRACSLQFGSLFFAASIQKLKKRLHKAPTGYIAKVKEPIQENNNEKT